MPVTDYFVINRRLIESDFWVSEPFSKPQAWIDLIAISRHTPGTATIRGIEIHLDRGQNCWSEIGLSSRWAWSRDKVRRFLKTLETRQQIIQQKNNVTTVMTIVNYNLYQIDNTANDTANNTPEKQQKNSKKTRSKKEEIDNNDNEMISFERFWSAYPKKKAKASAEKAWFKSNSKPDIDTIIEKLEIEKQTEDWKKQNGQFIPLASSWINGKRWNDEIVNQKQTRSLFDELEN